MPRPIPANLWALIVGVLIVGAVSLYKGGCSAADSADQRAYDDMATLQTVKEFEEKVEGVSRPVLVDFYADRCPPCRQLAPTIGSLAREYGDRVDFYRVDVDKAGKLAQEMRIQAIPTVYIYVNGEPLKKLNYASREAFVSVIEQALKEKASSQ